MFDTASLATFTVATTLLLVTPGPAVLFVVARSLEQGRTAGMVSMVGINSASLIHVGFAAFGLSALLMQSAAAFSAVKYVGAAYLLYLGVRTLMSDQQAKGHTSHPVKRSRLFTQGFIVNLLNPKTALFFLAFLPQFVDPSQGLRRAASRCSRFDFHGLSGCERQRVRAPCAYSETPAFG